MDAQPRGGLVDHPLKRLGGVAKEPDVAVAGLGPNLEHDRATRLQEISIGAQSLRREQHFVLAGGIGQGDEGELAAAGLGGAALLAAAHNAGHAERLGAGGVGLNCVQGARLAGAERIVAVDLLGARLGLATTFGATDVVDAATQDAVEAVRELTKGIGAMSDARVKDFFDKMVRAGVVKAGLDYRKSYTLQFVNKKVGLDLRPKQ